MKKVLSHILILFIVFANLFAPFTVGMGEKNEIEINSNKVEAETKPGEDDKAGVTVYAEAYKTDKTITIYAMPVYQVNSWWAGVGDKKITSIIFDSLKKETTKEITPQELISSMKEMKDFDLDDPEVASVAKSFLLKSPNIEKIYKITFPGLLPETDYHVLVSAEQNYTSWTTKIQNVARVSYTIGTLGALQLFNSDGSIIELEGATKNKAGVTLDITTLKEGETKPVSAGNAASTNEVGLLPICALNNIGGCVGIVLYRLVFQPSSYLFALSGKALDYTFNYSIKDTSYRSQFVVQGWGVVRDFCNLFFIFVLLYIAFGTILGIHSVKPKEMIINVVIIGLLINFSLFATQVIIDTSNILARVFYNSITIGDKVNGVVVEKVGAFGEKQISESIVKKVNPQKIIMSAGEANNIKAKGIDLTGDQDGGSIDNTTFIIVTILASAMNIIGLIVFFSVSLIMITRVIGLWLAMVFVPLAFFTYIIPQAQDLDMVGWKKWWPETLKLAFLAPVFMFFIYLIVKFLETGLGVMDASNKHGADFFIAVIVPFAFLMVLLTKAKSVATTMSGKLGQSITNGIAAVGGIALGVATGGAALAGRAVIGQTLAKASRGDTSTQKYEAAQKSDALSGGTAAMDKLSVWQKMKGATGSKLQLGKVYGETTQDALGKRTVTAGSGIGGLLNKTQKSVGEVDHARHVVDEAKDKAGFKDIDYGRLSGTQQQKVQDLYVKDNKSKWAQEEEDAFRKDKGLTDKEALTPAQVTELRGNVTARANAEFEKELHHASEKISGFSRAISQTNTGSMDVRKLSDIKSDKREGFFTKIPVAFTAAVAMGVRTGIKNVGMSNGGVKVEGDFMKDLGNTISDSLKSMKVNVDLGHVGETKSSGDPHAGGHH
ncbi:MAG: hypothetical protein UR85_C0002G0070 [Candidatus Nomurabacteria bacterium GW2011_GWF2_35_66]|uniref:Uncharacterized protein n=1 Tax=Candidatus Nomurabacteria bacterium GW2011_GWE1_35_16 TaxID=1618761 RepID=A0A0G0BBF5_9BACT|nr:MAG: hypothetical protein UR55_C0004G0030 [Candidatus Nomurabacteria bacterium GW2011_GWF1_34_20]KKP63469.1 MAG: hypothetical protein UR57_C0004G0030 [Candidatus Nomurabacteria bacterium GW2011_GWE2_34_25]KKP66649.1 MAG: hypothetical protein UR64_C0004G0030 [Candidatus Nomurabacteria bacterium GW2011_GWE1_35_16]KKP83757.1 MAG: hypothetical protein UR85_C0002G0070 [Candidatus Nomurabacteria bacterium GW2011_GWF2_35_66]HAE36448.1 hypothetical protein [Candidatus Nomurabacteria bacterium]